MIDTIIKNALGPIISQARNLRALHITFAYDTLSDAPRAPASSRARVFQVDQSENDVEGLERFLGYDALIEPDNERGEFSAFHPQRTIPRMEELEELATHFPESVKQFGVQSRVWQVSYVPVTRRVNYYSCGE